MKEEDPILDDEEFRRQIREEIEQRERERRHTQHQREVKRESDAEAERKRQIYREEMRKFYKNRPGYVEIVGEDGEVDWVPEEEATVNQELPDVVLEDPEVSKKWVRLSLVFIALLFITISITLFLIFYEGKGTIQVQCNVTDVQVFLDDELVDGGNEIPIEDVSAIEHFIRIEKDGYEVVGKAVQRFRLKRGEQKILTFVLQPISAELHSQDSTAPKDSIERRLEP
ncbi:MAG: hypothetical protein ABH878_08420 [bacterium]